MSVTLHFADEAALARWGAALAAALRVGDLIALEGPLGVGKTSLARAIIAALGHEGEVPSPSFALVQPYDELRVPLWHVDLYRLEEAGDADELGLDEARDSHALLVEWASHAGVDHWPGALRLNLEFEPAGGRRLTAVLPSAWEDRWP